MSFRFPQPSNEDDFELFCLRLLRELWNCPTLQQYGKRGERQNGIDLIDEAGTAPLRAVQCKHHESDKTLPPSEIEQEVAKAFGAGLPLDEYYILTTARKTTQSQNAVIRLNRAHAESGAFKVIAWTWIDIETRLSEMDEMAQERVLRGDTGRSGPAIARVMAATMSEHFDRPLYASASALDTELTIIQHSIDQYEFEVAENKLNEVELRAADKLQPHHLYQLKVLRSRIFSSRWKWAKAGRELLDAKRFLPESERARVNEALGYELLGECDRAHALATELRHEFPHNVRLLAIWVRTVPPSEPLDNVIEVASTLAKDDEELNLSLAARALTENRIAQSHSFAQRAAELSPNSARAWLMLGNAKHTEGYSGTTGIQTASLRQAVTHYDLAIQLAHDQKSSGLEAAARFNRGQSRHLLGDAGAESDFAIAVELAMPDQELSLKYASYLLELGRHKDALRVLELVSGEPTRARLFYEASAKLGRNIGDDRQQAAALLFQVIAMGPGERWEDAHVLVVQNSVENNSTENVRNIIQASSLREVNPLVFYTLNGWILFSSGDKEAARDAYTTALQSLTDSSSREHVYLLAQALVTIGDDEGALALLLRCYRPGVFNIECRKLLDCAQRLHRHDVSSRVCRELRDAGESDSRIILTEISIVQMYDPQEALRIANEYHCRHPDNHHVALWQSTLALRLGRRDLLISDLNRLPTADAVTPEGSGLVINVLRATDQSDEAIRYAYQALRTHFEQEFAHGQFIATFLRLSPTLRALDVGGTAGPGTAVCYREERAEADRWMIIEEEEEPDLALAEHGIDHQLSQAFNGRRVGEEVALPGASIQPRMASIRDIVHKYVYRFRDCMNQFQSRFPGGTACQVVYVGSGDNFDATPIIRTLEQRKQQIEKLDAIYRTNPMPLHTYAELAGRNEAEVWGHLATSHNLGIRCFNGRRDEIGVGLDQARRCNTLVVDLTAVLTLAHLGLLRVLRNEKRSIVVAQTTFDRLQHIAVDQHDDEREMGSVVLASDGRLARIETTPEEYESRIEFLASMRDAVRDNCQVRPCLQTARLTPQRREQMISAIGRHNVDSILLASEADTVLWSDDVTLGIVGRTDFQMSRVWTQVMLFVLQQEEVISRQEYDQAVAKLVGWHYQGVEWNAKALIAAAEIADWRMQYWPVPQVMCCLGNNELEALDRLRIAAEAVHTVWQSEKDHFRKQAFLFAVLAGIKSISLIRRLQQAIPRIFSLDVLSAYEVMECISAWLRHPTGGVLLP
jgi:tetratricopeptide (TPR) repeat protein